ncbi:MAG: hypothetical protein QXL01_00330 [Thermoplasmatales archaeon]
MSENILAVVIKFKDGESTSIRCEDDEIEIRLNCGPHWVEIRTVRGLFGWSRNFLFNKDLVESVSYGTEPENED